MPAVQVDVADNTEDQVDRRVDGPDEEDSPSVNDYLEMALEVAAETGMSSSELMGIFFYYAHSIADCYRQDALSQSAAGQSTTG